MDTNRVKRAAWVAGLAITCAAGWAAASGEDKVWRDVLDTPSMRSPLSARTLLNGLARAGNSVIAVGQRGHILYSDDAGKRWQQADVPVSSDLVAVSFPTARDGWAVGHDGVILHTKDGGRSWVVQLDGRRLGDVMVSRYERTAAAPGDDRQRSTALLAEARRFQQQGAENPLLDVWFGDAANGYAVGAFGLVLRTTDGGKTWEPMLHATDNPKGLHLYAVRGIGADIYIAGEQGLLLKLEAGDTRFRAIDLPYKGTLFGVTGSGKSLVAYGLRGAVWRSTDGGHQWQQVATGLQVGLTASTRDTDGRLFVASQAGHVLASRDDGASFEPVAVTGVLPAAAITLAAPSTLVVAGPRGIQSLQLP